MRIVPAARPDDGVLDVCLVHALSRLQVLRMLPRLYSGGHVAHPSVTLFRCRTLEVEVLSGISARVPAACFAMPTARLSAAYLPVSQLTGCAPLCDGTGARLNVLSAQPPRISAMGPTTK